MEDLYNNQSALIRNKEKPCPLTLELLASFERLLCYCHTGNTAVLATSLMHPLGLSRGTLKDGYPTLINPFQHPTVFLASRSSYQINPAAWPLKDGFPAVASKRAQVLSYSLTHFLVYLILSPSRLIISSPIAYHPFLGLSSNPSHILFPNCKSNNNISRSSQF